MIFSRALTMSICSCHIFYLGFFHRTHFIALAPKPVLFVVGLSKGYGAQLIDSSLL